MANPVKALPKRGSLIRPHLDKPDEYREVVATGGNSAATSVADAGSLSMTFSTVQEEGVADYLILQGGAATSLVAGAEAGLVGTTISSFKIGGNELIGGGNVPAQMFGWNSVNSPKISIPVDSTRAIVITGANNSGATAEYSAGITLS